MDGCNLKALQRPLRLTKLASTGLNDDQYKGHTWFISNYENKSGLCVRNEEIDHGNGKGTRIILIMKKYSCTSPPLQIFKVLFL